MFCVSLPATPHPILPSYPRLPSVPPYPPRNTRASVIRTLATPYSSTLPRLSVLLLLLKFQCFIPLLAHTVYTILYLLSKPWYIDVLRADHVMHPPPHASGCGARRCLFLLYALCMLSPRTHC